MFIHVPHYLGSLLLGGGGGSCPFGPYYFYFYVETRMHSSIPVGTYRPLQWPPLDVSTGGGGWTDPVSGGESPSFEAGPPYEQNDRQV